MLAKKKGGGKKGGKKNQKQSGFAWASNFELKPTESAALRELVETAVTTYKTRTGKDLHRDLLTKPGADVPKVVWGVPKCLLIVKREGDGVVCTYANPAAAEACGFDAADGYKSVIDQPRPELAAALGEGAKYESSYTKKLDAASVGGGETARVAILDGERWVLEKMAVVDGKLATEPIGVAYAWEAWELDDGTVCKPGGVREAATVDPAEVQAAIEAQGALVRKLKEEDGLTNGDPEVKEAVQELLRLKALVEADVPA